MVGLMKVPERELMGEVLLRDSAEPSLPVHVNIAKFVRLDDGQYVDTEDRGKTVKRRQLANAKERLRVSVRARVCVCACARVRASFVPDTCALLLSFSWRFQGCVSRKRRKAEASCPFKVRGTCPLGSLSQVDSECSFQKTKQIAQFRPAFAEPGSSTPKKDEIP